MTRAKAEIYWDAALVGKSMLSAGEAHIGIQVLSNSWWWQGNDFDDSALSWLIGKWGEDVVFGRDWHLLGNLFKGMEGPYQVIPCLIMYEVHGDTIKVLQVLPLQDVDIQHGIRAMLESVRGRG